ncbi:carboxymuconolactone decarboxylase family protein [Actinokineospora sp.]|uniref:carboxymuconolactone decarboxylase family protein n=1 Tax=Actinokineospora sp. TaxID=1872133 RepID=UPI004037E3E5
MAAHLSLRREATELFDLVYAFEAKVSQLAGDLVLTELVRLHVSQLNGCGFCIRMHRRDGAKAGATEEQLDALPAWRDADCFDARQKAALGFAETLTALPNPAAHEALATVRESFSDTEIAHLVVVIGSINSWNRMMIASGV